MKEIESMGIKDVVPNEVGIEMYGLISRLYPICRSITGDGLRETLNIIREYIPLECMGSVECV
jgi:aminopeptidase-like protein